MPLLNAASDIQGADPVIDASMEAVKPKTVVEEEFKYTIVRTSVQPDYAHLDLFHRAVFPIMLLAQCFAIMPLSGIWQPNRRCIRIAYKSLQIIITLAFLFANTFFGFSTIKHLLNIGVNAKNIVGPVFYTYVHCACIIFIVLARRWPRLIRYWTRIELLFTRSPYAMTKRSLARRVQLPVAVIIALSMIEHGLFLGSRALTHKRAIEICATTKNVTINMSFRDFMLHNFNNFFLILPYSHFIAVFILIVNGTSTFIWNYMDIFIMMVSKGIAYRFEQITARINKLENKEVPESTFVEIRDHYLKMCELLEQVDEHLSGIILLSCMNNLYFVCYQLLNVFNQLRWPINYVYFWYSLIYLIGRTVYVFLSAAAINDESKGALGVLQRVSTKSWCVEVERLIFQMSTQTVALSGKKFYFLTRRLLFGMAGTIVTYELVLLQFDEPNRVKGLTPLCV